jgi:hypothetical protein
MNLQRLVHSLQYNAATQLEASQMDARANVLSHAYHKEPYLAYLIPDAEARRIVSPWLFLSVIRAGQLYGEINTTESGDGAAVWISPFYDVSLRRRVRAALMSMPFGVGWGIARRCLKMAANVEEVRKRLAPVPHWYLMALGVRTSQPEKAIGEALIEPVLLRADSSGIPCYLETFSEEKLAFYKSYGFRITGAGRIPGGGPNFWAMTRAA